MHTKLATALCAHYNLMARNTAHVSLNAEMGFGHVKERVKARLQSQQRRGGRGRGAVVSIVTRVFVMDRMRGRGLR